MIGKNFFRNRRQRNALAFVSGYEQPGQAFDWP
jgi:hypothetical protein